MIKIAKFTFAPHDNEDKWRSFAFFGDILEHDVEFYKEYGEVKEKLDPSRVYQIGLDQSTSNTGIIIKDTHNEVAYMIEVKRTASQDATDYIYDIEMFIKTLCAGCNVSHLIYERPIKTEHFRSSQVLFQLEGAIKGMVKRYEEFKKAKLGYIENESWRAVVVAKDKYKDYARKEQVRLSVVDIFPWMGMYGPSIYKDNDIFEAIGVLFGWFYVSFDHLGRPYVKGDTFIGNIGGFCLPGMHSEDVANKFKAEGIEVEWAMANPSYSTYRNLASMVDKYKVVCVEFTDAYSMLCMSIECNFQLLDIDCMTVVLVAANYLDRSLLKITGEEYHFVL